MPSTPPSELFSPDRSVIFRTGWMSDYRGVTSNDQIHGGGSFVDDQGFGHEIFNFDKTEGYVYGYVQTPGRWPSAKQPPQIKIENLGARRNQNYVDEITVVWIAATTTGEYRVVGWYLDARVYRHLQHPVNPNTRCHDGEQIGFFATTKSNNATLIPSEDRTFQIPTRRDGGPGQSSVWYTNKPEHQELYDNLNRYLHLNTRESAIHTPPDRVQRTSNQIVRNPILAESVKIQQDYVCQICDIRLVLSKNRPYAESHHIQPLGQPHNGPDVIENMICVCPNCHKRLDYFSIRLDRGDFAEHARPYIDFHNSKIQPISTPGH